MRSPSRQCLRAQLPRYVYPRLDSKLPNAEPPRPASADAALIAGCGMKYFRIAKRRNRRASGSARPLSPAACGGIGIPTAQHRSSALSAPSEVPPRSMPPTGTLNHAGDRDSMPMTHIRSRTPFENGAAQDKFFALNRGKTDRSRNIFLARQGFSGPLPLTARLNPLPARRLVLDIEGIRRISGASPTCEWPAAYWLDKRATTQSRGASSTQRRNFIPR